jgi:hypothetical protein
MKVSAYLVGTLALVAFGIVQLWPPAASNAVHGEKSSVEHTVGSDTSSSQQQTPSALAYDGEPYYPRSFISPTVRQRYTAINHNSIMVFDEALSASGEWHKTSFQRSLNFAVMAIDYLQYDRFVVGGFTRANTIRLERWDLESTGDPVAYKSDSGNVISDVLEHKKFVRRVEFEGFPGCELLTLDADPDGRFYSVAVRVEASGEVKLYQLKKDSVSGSWSPNELASSNSASHLDNPVKISKNDHVALGRVFRLRSMTSNSSGIYMLIDSDNDTVFESTFEGTDEEFRQAGFGTYEDWISLK